MKITQFLTARIDDDEIAALYADEYARGVLGPDRPNVGMQLAMDLPALIVDERRVLREVAAKRAILAEHREEGRGDHRGCAGCGWCPGDEVRLNEVEECPTLRALAAVHADHPDYNQRWSPDDHG